MRHSELGVGWGNWQDLQIGILRISFYRSNSSVSSYLEKH